MSKDIKDELVKTIINDPASIKKTLDSYTVFPSMIKKALREKFYDQMRSIAEESNSIFSFNPEVTEDKEIYFFFQRLGLEALLHYFFIPE